MRTRTRSVHFRVNEQEFQHLNEQVYLSGYSKSRYLRNLVKGSEIKPRPREETIEFRRQLFAIGNNINQIAKIANTYKRIRQEDVEYIINAQTTLNRMIKRL